MENQINMGDQNNQQIGQNPINQSTKIPEKPKFNYWMISTLTLAVLLLGIFGWYIFSVAYQANQNGSGILPTKLPLPNESTCSQNIDCVIGIQATSCCSCPKAINKNLVGTKNWEQYEYGKDYSPRKSKSCDKTIACSPCEWPEKPICSNGQCQFSATPTSQDSCEIGKEYENTAANPVKCKCPEGYRFETLSMGWGSCSQPGMRDCPSSILKCVTTDSVSNLNPEGSKTYKTNDFTLKYPSGWNVSTKQIEYYDPPTLILTKVGGKKTSGGYELPQFWIGSFEIYSTSGAICANEPYCEKVDKILFSIKGKSYSTDVFKKQIWESGKFTGNYFYVFQIGVNSELDSIPSKPTITGQFDTTTEKLEIENILSSINY